MAKKIRKSSTRRPLPTSSATPTGPAAPASPPSGDEGDESLVAVPAPVVRQTGLPMSPLAREQERELEVGLTAIGLVVGGLTGFSQVPFGAPEGNVTIGVLSALMGALTGLSVGRSLFLSMRAQWFVWVVMAVLSVGGFFVGGQVGGDLAAVVGAAVGLALATAFLFFGLRRLALAAERAAEGKYPTVPQRLPPSSDEPPE